MEDHRIVSGGEDHLGLEARLEEEAVSRHCAASARRRGKRTEVGLVSVSIRQRYSRFPVGGTCC